MNEVFEKLRQDRRDMVEVLKRNKSDLLRLLTDLYPDNAHFIFELLQNAEDTFATEVSFVLDLEKIEFKHNGKRLFSFKDVEGITGIGISTKRDDPTSIGKFGVGFKAVFAYTNTPEIHSGDYHFKICDLVVPETEGIKNLKTKEEVTSFSFPFDNPKKTAKIAVEEISKGLINLGDNILLFLNHIRKIEYLLPDGKTGSLQRIDHKDQQKQIEIHVLHPDQAEIVSQWLRFDKKVDILDEVDLSNKSYYVAIAYKLQKMADKDLAKWEIRPIDGQVSIYFPAEKETSNLRFHINAPFASTVARDSVRDCDGNNQLRDHLAKLIVESLDIIRDQKLLTVDFLAVLPNYKDNLSRFYIPIRDEVLKAFQNKKLTPTKNKTYAAAKTLYRGPASICKILDDEGLAVFTQKKPPLWVANPKQLNQREDEFLENLKIDRWERDDLFSELGSEDLNKHEKIHSWLTKKPDSWLIRFYEVLSEEYRKTRSYDRPGTDNWQIIRVSTEQGDLLVTPGEAHFLPDEDIDFQTNVYFVKEDVYLAKKPKEVNEDVKEFLRKIGVKRFDGKEAKEKAALEAQNVADAQTVLELGLDRYHNPPKQIGEDHFEDLKSYITYWKENQKSAIRVFNDFTFLVGKSNNKLYWRKPGDLCLDSPYLETGLDQLVNIHEKYVLWDGYQGNLDNSYLEVFVDFLEAIGVKNKVDPLEVIRIYDNYQKRENIHNRFFTGTRVRDSMVWEDYSIFKLREYLNIHSVATSRLIWEALIKADKKFAKARYSPNQNQKNQPKETDSQLVEDLKTHPWIPDRTGVFHFPQDMTRDTLRDDFTYSNDLNGLLAAIGFGENTEYHNNVQTIAEEWMHDNGGISRDEYNEILELRKRGLLPKLAQPRFPEDPLSSNSERRTENLIRQYNQAPRKKYEQTSRSNRRTKATIDKASWLRNKYKNEKGELICQICKCKMPFMKRNSKEYYFEAVEAFSREYFPREYESQYLALCPECAARYEEFVIKDDKAMESFRQAIIDSGTAEVPLQLGEWSTSVRFVETHWHDIKTILNISE
jgi:hypothetical protein